MKKTKCLPMFIFILLFFTGISQADYHILIDHTCTDLSTIPATAISQAKSNLHIAYQHTSHGSQLITGMNALASYPDFGDTYAFSDTGASGLDLDDYGIPGVVDDLSQGDYIDGNGVTPWVTSTRHLLDDPSNSHVNVIMWSWCSINDHDAQRYVDNMEILISEYGQGGSKVSPTRPAVQFVFMTGHAEGQGEDLTPGGVHYNNELIRNHCRNNNRILFDFADIEAYNPGNHGLQNPGYQYFWDLDMQDNLDYTGGNWAAEWISLYPDSEPAKLTTGDGVDGYEGCSDCAHSSSPPAANLNCVLKGRAAWWLWARLAGWPGNASCFYAISPSSGSFASSGGTRSVSITASSSTCAWTASESLDWVHLSPATGTGSGSVTITAAANTGAARSGAVTIAGQPYTISQQAGVSPKITTVLTDTSPDHTISADTDVQVYGTSASNQIILESNAKAELLNFPGQNAIQIQTGSNLFTVFRSGSVVTFQGSDGTLLKIPATTFAQTISFNGEQSRVLQIHDKQVKLDDQVVTTTAAPVENNQVSAPGVIKSSVSYDAAPVYSSADQTALVSGFSEFSMDFYHALRTEPSKAGKNLFFSPYSIENALAMTWAGAKNQTADQMADALHFYLPQNQFHPALNALNIDINSRDDDPLPSGDPFSLNLVNAIWSRIGYPFLPAYLDVIAKNYDAGIRTLDFAGNPDGSRQTINQWVEEQTNEKIKDLLPSGSISPLTAVVLTNAIYFKGAWHEKFNVERTAPGPFTLLDGTTVTAQLMHRETDTRFYRGSGFDAVELAYASPEFSEYEYPMELAMLVIIPDSGRFESVESSLDKTGIDAVFDSLSMGKVNLTFPKFEFESETSCKKILNALGMTDAFDESLADFSGMVSPVYPKPWIDEIFHKAFVAVDENGTEAGAATAVLMGATSIPEVVNISADKPFMFIIYDHFTQTILFMGRVLDPTA